MKKILLPIILLLIVAGLYVIKVRADNRREQQTAILSVFNEADAATTQTRVFPNGRTVVIHSGNKMFSRAEFAKALNRINITQCPVEFNIAWMNFVQTVQRNQEPFAGLGAMGEYGVSVAKTSAEGTRDALARLDRLNAPEAYRHVVMVALKYGVQIHDK